MRVAGRDPRELLDSLASGLELSNLTADLNIILHGDV